VPARELVAVEQALAETRAALEAIAARANRAGSAEIALTPDDLDTTFPPNEAPGRAVAPAELAEAEAEWAAAATRGYRHRARVEATLGPLLMPSDVAARLGVSTVTVNNWRRRGRLLAIRLDAHQYRYPAFQFADTPAEGEAGLVAGLDELLAQLAAPDAWTALLRLATPDPFLGGHRPIDLLRSGDPSARGRLRRWAAGVGELGM
jgi:hypothetical protein